MCIFNKTYFCYGYATWISYFIGLLSICTILVPMDQNVYVLYTGGPNFSYFTTVIVINFVINFEADYLLNRWTYRNTGVTLVHNFWFPATFIPGKNWSDPWWGRYQTFKKPISPYYSRLSLHISYCLQFGNYLEHTSVDNV